MNNNIVSKSFYLSSLFSDIKPDVSWTNNELKLVLLIFSKLSKHRIYLPDFDYFDNNMEEFYSMINKIPLEYKFSKQEFQGITGVTDNHLSREIKKTIKKLLSKTMITPHPLDQNDNNSIEGVTWFSRINYLDKTGVLNIEMNKYALERLVALIKYSNIDLEIISKLSNHNSIYIYLTLKILKDSTKHKNIRTLRITLDEFKKRLSLENKYRSLSTLEKYVLKIIEKDLNLTDIDFSYKLEKGESGKAKKYIEMTFDYKSKPKSLEQNRQPIDERKLKYTKKSSKGHISTENSESYFEAILIGWGIRAKVIAELEEKYKNNLEVIYKSIEITQEAIEKNIIEKTPAAYFFRVLENKEYEQEFQNKQKQEKDKKEKLQQGKLKRDKEYDEISSFILTNEDIVKSALTLSTKYLPIMDTDIIPIIKKLNDIDADKFRGYTIPLLTFYHFEANTNVSSDLSDILDRFQHIKASKYSNDIEKVQVYKDAFENIKSLDYFSNEQKEYLKKEVQECIKLDMI